MKSIEDTTISDNNLAFIAPICGLKRDQKQPIAIQTHNKQKRGEPITDNKHQSNCLIC